MSTLSTGWADVEASILEDFDADGFREWATVRGYRMVPRLVERAGRCVRAGCASADDVNDRLAGLKRSYRLSLCHAMRRYCEYQGAEL